MAIANIIQSIIQPASSYPRKSGKKIHCINNHQAAGNRMCGSHKMWCCQVFILALCEFFRIQLFRWFIDYFCHAHSCSHNCGGVPRKCSSRRNQLRRPSPAHSQDTAAPTSRPKRRVYALCPPKFHRVGTDCYSLVDQRSSWLEAHFFCKDKNANLTEPGKHADRKLRLFLQKQDALSGGE